MSSPASANRRALSAASTASSASQASRRPPPAGTADPAVAAALRAYLDDPNFGTTQFWDQFLLPNIKSTPTFKPVLYESTTNTGPFVDVRYAQTQTASLSGEYFGGRVHSLVGASWNSLTRKIPTDAAYATDARGYFTHPGLPWEEPNLYSYDPRFNLSAVSKMAEPSTDRPLTGAPCTDA